MLKKSKLYIAIYILVILIYTASYCYINFKHLILLDSPGLGDFLSGLFAPIAFIYLFLGYKQQEEALNKTNSDLLEQLNIQKKMLDLQIADQRAKEHAALPIIEPYFSFQLLPIESGRINQSTQKPHVSFKKDIILHFRNSGEKVSQVTIRCISPFEQTICFNEILSDSKDLKIKLSLTETKLQDYSNEGLVDLEISLDFVTTLGIKYRIIYEIQISDDEHGDIFNYGGLIGITRISE
ncbi:hypothetical protein A9988_09880 [Acinetobacter calcoaceticus]|nr:hypothetical protein A9988_09880 [Acinetobacter calcoaceticus]